MPPTFSLYSHSCFPLFLGFCRVSFPTPFENASSAKPIAKSTCKSAARIMFFWNPRHSEASSMEISRFFDGFRSDRDILLVPVVTPIESCWSSLRTGSDSCDVCVESWQWRGEEIEAVKMLFPKLDDSPMFRKQVRFRMIFYFPCFTTRCSYACFVLVRNAAFFSVEVVMEACENLMFLRFPALLFCSGFLKVSFGFYFCLVLWMWMYRRNDVFVCWKFPFFFPIFKRQIY